MKPRKGTKVHRKEPLARHKVFCNASVAAPLITERWCDVTCKKCLKMRAVSPEYHEDKDGY